MPSCFYILKGSNYLGECRDCPINLTIYRNFRVVCLICLFQGAGKLVPIVSLSQTGNKYGECGLSVVQDLRGSCLAACLWPRIVLIKCDFLTAALPPFLLPLSKTILSGSGDLYQWSAISSASPFIMETWCLIFAISFLKLETKTKEWNFWRPLSSWRLHHRMYEKEKDQTPFFSIHPCCPLRSDLNTFFSMKFSALPVFHL